jgi:hypothetical protein
MGVMMNDVGVLNMRDAELLEKKLLASSFWSSARARGALESLDVVVDRANPKRAVVLTQWSSAEEMEKTEAEHLKELAEVAKSISGAEFRLKDSDAHVSRFVSPKSFARVGPRR